MLFENSFSLLIGLSCFANVCILRHPSVFRTVSVGTCSFTLLFEAERVEGGLNSFTSIPAAAIVVFIHQATVSFDIGLHGFNVVINSEVIFASPWCFCIKIFC